MNCQEKYHHLYQQVHLGCQIHLSPISIVRLEAVRNYTFVDKDDGMKILFAVTLKRLEETLKFSGLFIRVNRKDAINVNHILEYNPMVRFC